MDKSDVRTKNNIDSEYKERARLKMVLTATASDVHDFEIGTFHDHNIDLTGCWIITHGD